MTAPVENGVPDPLAVPESSRRWRVAAVLRAITVLIIVGCIFYLVQNVPQADPIQPETDWPVQPSEQLRLHSLKSGTVLRLNFSAEAAAKLSFPIGTRLTLDGVTFEQPSSGPMEANLFNVDQENAEIEFQISPPLGKRGTLILEPASPDPQSLSFRVRSDDAPLTLRIFMVIDPSIRRHGHIRIGDGKLDDAWLTLPVGATVTIRMRVDQLKALRTEVGELKGDMQTLDLSAVEIASVANDKFERRSLACGAPVGKLLLSYLWSRLSIKDCETGHLKLVKLGLTSGAAVVNLTGPGFTVRDRTTNVWEGFTKLSQNPLVAAVLALIIAGLLGWVSGSFRGQHSP